MKRGRTEEIQFGQPRTQPPPGQQRIITTTQPHNVASTAGSTIQYQIPPNVIKTASPPDSASNLSTQHLAPPQQTVQYTTTTYNSTIGNNLVKGQQVTNQQQATQQQQIQLVNATTQARGATVHKGGTVVNATSVSSVTGAPTSGTAIVGVAGGQIITTNMSPGVQSQGPPQSAPQGQAQLQRLKVEDALSYLDQVKYRFGNQPQVYNDFLDIMKEFKSQSIDTPGVIQRVSNLFKGHPELIVGFNTFLPPGYKIELQANDQGYAFQVSVSMPSSSSTGTSIAQQPSPHKYNTIFQGGGQIVQSGGGTTNVVNASTGIAGGGTTAVNLMAYGGGHAAATTVTAATSANAPSSHGGTLQQTTGGSVGNASPATAQNAQPMSTGQQTTTAAAGPASQVPQSFGTRGDHHQQPQQQQQHHRERTISTGSVTSNASLPSTTTSTVVTTIDASQQQSIHRMISQQIISQQQQQQQQQQTASVVSAGAAVSASGGGALVSVTAASQTQQQQQQQQQHHHQQNSSAQSQQIQHQQAAQEGTGAAPTTSSSSSSSAVVAAVATTNQPVEFNHAISYVNKIKNRFHSEPEKYKRFLEILHTYQKEQKTYKEGALAGGCMTNAKQLTEAEVYTQVAQLFDNQEDLLREFGQFLPDATGHHGQVATQQQHQVASSNKNNHIFVNAVLHDSHQQQLQQQQHQQQQQLGQASGNASVVAGSTMATGVHGVAGGKKLANSGVIGGGGGLANASLKIYNNLQQANMARLQQERDYSPIGGQGDGKEYSIITSVPASNIAGGRGGNVIGSVGVGGVVLVEKDRNHIAGAGGTGSAVAIGAGGLNSKYIHGASLASIATGGGAGGMLVHGAGGAVLAAGAPPGMVGTGMGVPVMANLATSGGSNAVKRSPSYSSQMAIGGGGSGGGLGSARGERGEGSGPPPMKRHKPICRDVSLAEAAKYGALNDYAFFDKVRNALRSPDSYENFLRCLTLYNQEIVSKSELVTLVSPFLSRFPDLQKWFQDFLGPASSGTGSGANDCISLTAAAAAAAARQDRSQGELTADIDLATCKRLGASYCALPKSHESIKCSGRTSLCRDVLNDTWVSFPTWAEDSTFVTSRKTQYEEFIYRCEDERFELDVVIETNSATIRVLEGIQKKLTRMSQDEISRFRLDDCLGGTSPTIHQRALKRIYGDKAADMIQGLKKNPAVAVPVVLRRMKAKEEEWREAQKSFNKQWRDQNEKYYLKSLDHQGINFKQTDIKALRSKSLFNEIEILFDERHEQNDETSGAPTGQTGGPHMTLPYKDKTILEDAANLLIHHVKRQTGIQKQEKARIKHILRQFVPDLFFAPRQQLSEDEREEDDKDADGDQDEEDCAGGKSGVKKSSSSTGNSSSALANNNSTGNSCNTNVSTFEETVAAGTGTSSRTAESGATPSTKDEGASNSGTNIDSVKIASSSEMVATSTAGAPMVSGSSANLNADSNGSVKESSADSPTSDKQLAIKTEVKDENELTMATGDGASSTTGIAQDQQTTTGPVTQQPMSPPLPLHAVSKHIEEAYTLFFANNHWYLFLRFHAILCERLRIIYERAQIIAAEERAYESTRNNSTATALRLKPKSEIRIEEYYNVFLDMLKNLLDGNMESSSYEDTLREMFGIHAYNLFTLDRVVTNAVRQLQHCVTERGAIECVELYQAEQRRGGAGGLCRTANRRIAAELAYQRKAESALQDENCFKVYIYKIDCRLTIELLDTESDDTANNFANSQAYSSYVDRLSNPAATGTGSDSGGGGGGGGNGPGTMDTNSASIVAGSSGSGSTAPVGSNANSTNSNNVGSGGGAGSGGSTGNAEVKIEKPDDEMLQPEARTSLRRRPVFLPRNIRHKRRGQIPIETLAMLDSRSLTTDAVGKGNSSRENIASDERKAVSMSKSRQLSKSTIHPTTPVTETTSKSAKPSKDGEPNGSGSEMKLGTTSLFTPATDGTNNNNTSMTINNNSIGERNSPLWNAGGNEKSCPERLPSMNGVDRNEFYIEDTEQVKVNRSFKTSLVESKNFTLFRKGSLRRSRKCHPIVTTSKNRKFQAFVDRWLERHVSSTQQASCVDWLLGKRPDLAKNLTTVVVRDKNSTRTPYKPYNRYKVEYMEVAGIEES